MAYGLQLGIYSQIVYSVCTVAKDAVCQFCVKISNKPSSL